MDRDRKLRYLFFRNIWQLVTIFFSNGTLATRIFLLFPSCHIFWKFPNLSHHATQEAIDVRNFFYYAKKVALLLEIDRVKFFYHSPIHMVDCVLGQVFLIKKNKIKNKKTRQKQAKETHEEKRIIVENLTRYDDIVCELTLCSFK